jgi:hypothetical protein
MPKERAQNDRSEGDEKTQYLVNPVHSEPGSMVRERVAKDSDPPSRMHFTVA